MRKSKNADTWGTHEQVGHVRYQRNPRTPMGYIVYFMKAHD